MTLQRLSKSHASAVVLLVAGTVLASVSSCDNGCEQKRESYMHAEFVSTSGRTLKQLSILCKSDSMQYEVSQINKFENIEIDLNPKDTVTSLLLTCTYSDYGDVYTVTDSVSISYETQTRFLDMACGCSITYDITQVTHTGELLSNIITREAHIHPDSGINLTFEY